jgi:ferritin
LPQLRVIRNQLIAAVVEIAQPSNPATITIGCNIWHMRTDPSADPMLSTDATQAPAPITVNTGPAGRAMAQPMDAELVEALQQHLTMERQASAAYFAMAIWFAERELRGFGHFFKHEAQDEQEHAGTVADYLIARGQTVVLQDISAPRQSWASAEEIVAASFAMEADVTSSLQQLYAMAERAGDTRTTVFLDPLVDNQVASEGTFAHVLGRVRFAQNQPAALLIIDGELSDDKHHTTKLG